MTVLTSPPQLEPSWHAALSDELSQPYMTQLFQFLEEEYAKNVVFPPKDLIFNAFNQTPYSQVKVVIMGQDPYHQKGQAHGLSFSVPMGIKQPPSLRNIFLELNKDLGITPPNHGCLISWARQGVLLLNATLTVREGEPKSHYGRGWERFTDLVIAKLVQHPHPLVFLLWGKSAQEKCEHVLQNLGETRHLLLTAAHPSPYSATGFFGCRHFSKANQFLVEKGLAPIDWALF